MLSLYVTSTEKNEHRFPVLAGLAGVMQSLGYSVCVYKPVQLDCYMKDNEIRSKEFDYLINTDSFVDIKCSYMFKNASNPLLASVAEGKLIDREQILEDFKTLADKYECLLVDGLEGPGTPLNMDFLESDMMRDFGLPILFVVSAIDSKLNNILTVLKSSSAFNIPVRGVIIIDYPEYTEDNNIKFMPRFIEEYTDIKVLGVLPKINPNMPPEELIDFVLNGIDIEAVFDVAIAKLEK